MSVEVCLMCEQLACGAGAQAASLSCGLTTLYLELSSKAPAATSPVVDRACAAAALCCLLAFSSSAKVNQTSLCCVLVAGHCGISSAARTRKLLQALAWCGAWPRPSCVLSFLYLSPLLMSLVPICMWLQQCVQALLHCLLLLRAVRTLLFWFSL